MLNPNLEQELEALAGCLTNADLYREPLSFLSLEPDRRLSGIIVVDIDGTLDDEEGNLNEDALFTLRLLRDLGVTIVLSTSRSRDNTTEVLSRLSQPVLPDEARTNWEPRLYACVDRGAIGLEVTETRSGGSFTVREIFRHVIPSSKLLYNFLRGKQAQGDLPNHPLRDEETDPVKMVLKTKLPPADAETSRLTDEALQRVKAMESEAGAAGIPWDQIRIEATRTAVVITSMEAGKDVSTGKILRILRAQGVKGPAAGLGDKQDEFASVVPTINVNAEKKDAFEGFSVLGDVVPHIPPGGERTAFYLRCLTGNGYFDT